MQNLEVIFVSRGMWKLTTTRYNKKISLLTNDSELIDKIKDGQITAIRTAIRRTRLNNFLKR